MFGCDDGIKKDADIFETLGTLDELNSFLGICKVQAGNFEVEDGIFTVEIIEDIQQALFIVQANLAGAEKDFSNEKVKKMEKLIDKIEKVLPPINNFSLSGGSELSACLDYARAFTRKVERRFVKISQTKKVHSVKEISIYLNRLSSLLYALSRFVNLKSGIKEVNPTYE